MRQISGDVDLGHIRGLGAAEAIAHTATDASDVNA